MITGEIKNKVDTIWTDIWAGGITNPITVIEQLTYLMFMRTLDDKDLQAERFENQSGEKMPRIFPKTDAGQAMRWSKFKNKNAQEIYDIVAKQAFPFIKELGSTPTPKAANEQDTNTEQKVKKEELPEELKKETAFARYMQDAMFLFPEGNKELLQSVITSLDELYEQDIKDKDMLGDLYEYMLSKLSTAGHNGQFRTPKHIRELMVALLAPTPDDKICDPACGTAGYLVSAAEYIRREYEAKMSKEQWDNFAGPMFAGFDSDQTMLRISAMNLMLHSITNPEIDYKDSVSKSNDVRDAYTMILANPPFTGNINATSINEDLKAICDTKKTELLFVALFLRLLEKGGRCACIVPDGVLFGSTKAHKSLRKELVENHHLQAVISMPSGVFKPYAGVSTAILIFTKTGAGGTDKVWFYDTKADGYSLDDKRTERAENDIPDIIQRFHNLADEQDRQKTEQSFLVDKSEIAANDYDLSLNSYKETVYEKVEYDKPEVIMNRLGELDKSIEKKMQELRSMLNE